MSFLSAVPFVAPEPVPWNWNPGATFMQAYYDAQENQRARQEFEVQQELSRILLPAKAAEAEYNLKKFQLDAQLLEKMHKAKSASLDAAYNGITSAVTGRGASGSGASSNVAGNVGSSNQAGVYQSRFGFGSKLTPPAASAPQAIQPVARKVGSGVMPKQP